MYSKKSIRKWDGLEYTAKYYSKPADKKDL